MRIDQTAIIGHPPESRDWPDRMPGIQPRLGRHVHIEAYVTIDAGTERPTSIGDRAYLLKHAHVGHDAIIGPDTEISTGAVIGGHAEIGAQARVGINATILPYRKIGPGARIGAGAVVTKDVPAGETWVGNPARKLETYERDPRPHTDRNELSPAASKAISEFVTADLGGRIRL